MLISKFNIFSKSDFENFDFVKDCVCYIFDMFKRQNFWNNVFLFHFESYFCSWHNQTFNFSDIQIQRILGKKESEEVWVLISWFVLILILLLIYL